MVEVIKERIFSAIVCCDIDPEEEDCFDKLDKQLKSIYNGTTGGWKALRPDREEFSSGERSWDKSKPVPCKDIADRWHYVVIT
jgi:hypothetical protein